VHVRLGRFSEDLFPQLTRPTTLDGVQLCINPVETDNKSTRSKVAIRHSLVSAINSNVDLGIDGSIPEGKTGFDDQLLRLET
jgi:hypothetical protein